MDLNDMLRHFDIDPPRVLVLRHTPGPKFRKDFLRLARTRPDLFDTYQQFQTRKVERDMENARYLASFFGHKPGTAVFLGMYAIEGARPLTVEEYWQIPAHEELKTRFDERGFTGEDGRPSILRFDLREMAEFYGPWKGKLVVGWPPPEVRWWRRAEPAGPADAELARAGVGLERPS